MLALLLLSNHTHDFQWYKLSLLPKVPYVDLNQSRSFSYPKSPKITMLVGLCDLTLLNTALPELPSSTSPNAIIFRSLVVGGCTTGGCTTGGTLQLVYLELLLLLVVE